MKVIIKNYENQEYLGEIEYDKGTKISTVANMICEYLIEKYNCNITRRLIECKIEFDKEKDKFVQDRKLKLIGENLPCKEIKFEMEEN